MDFDEKDKSGLEKKVDHLSCHSSISANWQFGNTSIAAFQGNSSIEESFSPNLWNHPSGPPRSNSNRPNMGWSSSETVHKSAAFLLSDAGILPQNLPEIPADSAFIERAAKLSCFNGGNLVGMMNPFGPSESFSPYPIAAASITNIREVANDVTKYSGHVSSNHEIPDRNRRDSDGSGEPELNRGHHEENFCSVDTAAAGDSSSEGFGSKKRKRRNQDVSLDQVQGRSQVAAETAKESTEAKLQKGERNSSQMPCMKPAEKQGKNGTDAPKEDYVHVRARRGQATNSHSLAERVRREKISERMKYLQDLVPGCSKVTGKAVMLDEIINYVQSLQRQVEFLSMKLAAVNPHLDFNIEGLLAKDLFQLRMNTSSAFSFSPDLIHAQLYPPQQFLAQAGISGTVNSSDTFRRAMNAQLTDMGDYKEALPQVTTTWDDEIHNVASLPLGSNPPLNTQEFIGKHGDGFSL